jgi:streptomycin 6-kinase
LDGLLRSPAGLTAKTPAFGAQSDVLAEMSELRVPEPVVRMVTGGDGQAGRRWLEELPGIVSELTRRWSLHLGPPFEGGCVAYVAPGIGPGGKHIVLKVSFPDEETLPEADALAFWGGRGAVRLLEADRDGNAMLLERLVPGTPLEDHSDRDEAISIGCRLLRRLWRPVPSDHPFPTVRDLMLRWARELPEQFAELGDPFERRLLDEAADLCVEFASWDGDPILANRDFHLGNVLAAEREPWLLIDPKPLAGEPAFDTGHLLRTLFLDRPDRATATKLSGRIGSALDLDPDRIRAWSFVRSVDDALWELSRGGSDWRRYVDCARALLPPAS